MENQKSERLGSLDVLRGFDLFCLVFFQPVFVQFAKALDWPLTNWLATFFDHVNWEGFAFWDISSCPCSYSWPGHPCPVPLPNT